MNEKRDISFRDVLRPFYLSEKRMTDQYAAASHRRQPEGSERGDPDIEKVLNMMRVNGS